MTHVLPLNHQRPSTEYAGSQRSPFHHHWESGEWALDPDSVTNAECRVSPRLVERSQQ